MNKELAAEHDRLTKTEATKWQMMEYSWAIKALAEGLTGNNVWDQFRHIETAQRYLSEFKGHFTKNLKLSEEEANLARGLHTYMRKGMDSDLSCILYNLISESRGLPRLVCFCQGTCGQQGAQNCLP
jgi:hypothetical protein